MHLCPGTREQSGELATQALQLSRVFQIPQAEGEHLLISQTTRSQRFGAGVKRNKVRAASQGKGLVTSSQNV